MQKAFLKFLIFCGVLFGLIALVLSCSGADLNAGYSWTPTDRVTSAKLNSVISGAAINTTFLSDRTAVQPVSGDAFLLYQATSQLFRKSTFGTMFLNNTNLIIGQSEDTLPVGGDSILTYDLSANALKRSQLDSAFFTNAALIVNRSNIANPPSGLSFLGYYSGLYYQVTISNLLTFTNLATCNVLHANHELLIWDFNFKTNRQTTLSGLVTNAASNASMLAADRLWGYRASTGNPGQFTPTNIALFCQNYITNESLSPTLTNHTPVKFVSTNAMPAAGDITTFTHGLAGMPQSIFVTLVCTNAAGDAATQYALGDEINIMSASSASGNALATIRPTSTTINVTFNSSATFTVLHAATGASTSVSSRNNWNVKCTAVYFP